MLLWEVASCWLAADKGKKRPGAALRFARGVRRRGGSNGPGAAVVVAAPDALIPDPSFGRGLWPRLGDIITDRRGFVTQDIKIIVHQAQVAGCYLRIARCQ
jgi:hypothetical protein